MWKSSHCVRNDRGAGSEMTTAQEANDTGAGRKGTRHMWQLRCSRPIEMNCNASDMNAASRTTSSQEGSVLVVALLILVFLTLIGISSTRITEVEIQIAGNERAYNIAFNTADSGVYVTPKVIRRSVDDGVQPTFAGGSGISYLNASGQPDSGSGSAFYREVMGFAAHDAADDISFTLNTHTVKVDITRAKQMSVAGGGVEFGSGAEGVGVGSAGGVAVIYDLDSKGTGPNSARSNVFAEYRLVPGVAGGL